MTFVTSKQMNDFEGDLSLIEIDINDSLHYYDGNNVSISRTGHKPVNGRLVFANAMAARDYAEKLIRAADEMDLRIARALDR